MKNNQDNTRTLSALLRTADGVDTLETNSLCCAAAGIIAPSSTTTGALIPHEKLRGAALADATLNAQERPLAQPAMGYTQVSNAVNSQIEANTGRSYRPADLTRVRPDECASLPHRHTADLQQVNINRSNQADQLDPLLGKENAV